MLAFFGLFVLFVCIILVIHLSIARIKTKLITKPSTAQTSSQPKTSSQPFHLCSLFRSYSAFRPYSNPYSALILFAAPIPALILPLIPFSAPIPALIPPLFRPFPALIPPLFRFPPPFQPLFCPYSALIPPVSSPYSALIPFSAPIPALILSLFRPYSARIPAHIPPLFRFPPPIPALILPFFAVRPPYLEILILPRHCAVCHLQQRNSGRGQNGPVLYQVPEAGIHAKPCFVFHLNIWGKQAKRKDLV